MSADREQKWFIVDAHEDIAWNKVMFDRDVLRSVVETRNRERGTAVPEWVGQSLLGYPEWQAGNVKIVFATLFLTPSRRRHNDWEHLTYDDADEAHRQYHRQLDIYTALVEDHPEKLVPLTSRAGLGRHLVEAELGSSKVGFVLCMEGGDAIRTPEEVRWWHERGVRIIGPAWSGTRYSGGTYEPGPLSSEGRALLDVMAEHDIVLDVSHMSDEGIYEALERYPQSVIASHANPRALLPSSGTPERHLSDDAIRGIAAREGVIGTVLYNPFLKDGWRRGHPREEVTLEHVAATIDYICQLLGTAKHVGLGSDFDGCVGLDSVPVGLDSVADLRFIGDILKRWGYKNVDIEAVMGTNWIKLLDRSLPEG